MFQSLPLIHCNILTCSQSRGSPAYHYGLAPTNFLTAVNSVSTPDLDSFVREVRKIPDNEYFRIRAVTFDNVPWVVTMKKNDHYVSSHSHPLPHSPLCPYIVKKKKKNITW